jgi:hypothetical protein
MVFKRPCTCKPLRPMDTRAIDSRGDLPEPHVGGVDADRVEPIAGNYWRVQAERAVQPKVFGLSLP